MAQKLPRNKQQEYVDLIKEQIPAKSHIPDKELMNLVFFNVRTLKLTRPGYFIIKLLKDEIKIDLPVNYVIRSNHLLYLDRYLSEPYYIQYGKTQNFLSIFDDEDAFELIMFNGDLDGYVKMKKNHEEMIRNAKDSIDI